MTRHGYGTFGRYLAIFTLFCCLAFPARSTVADPGWPRYYSNGSAGLAVYQPQVEAWSDFKVLKGRCALALSPDPGRDPVYGTFRFEAETLVDADHKLVLLRSRPNTGSAPRGRGIEQRPRFQGRGR